MIRWLQRLFLGSGEESISSARAALERGALEDAWRIASAARGADAKRIASRVARARGALELAVRFDRAADDPADTGRLAELAGALARAREIEPAIAVLEEALAMAPFDAVLRSELALLLARAARPAESAAVLALHPCLADDPGALFQFAWSSLLAGDLGAARECVVQLAERDEVASLAEVLEGALARAAVCSAPRDLREWMFVEHGAVLLDAASPRASATPSEVARSLLGHAASAIDGLGRPRRIIAGNDASREGAARLAEALEVELAPPPRAGIPEGLVVVDRADALAELAPHIRRGGAVRSLAWILEIESAPSVPDVVGAVVHRAGAGENRWCTNELGTFVEARRAVLPPRRPRVMRAFVPDAPIDWRGDGARSQK